MSAPLLLEVLDDLEARGYVATCEAYEEQRHRFASLQEYIASGECHPAVRAVLDLAASRLLMIYWRVGSWEPVHRDYLAVLTRYGIAEGALVTHIGMPVWVVALDGELGIRTHGSSTQPVSLRTDGLLRLDLPWDAGRSPMTVKRSKLPVLKGADLPALQRELTRIGSAREEAAREAQLAQKLAAARADEERWQAAKAEAERKRIEHEHRQYQRERAALGESDAAAAALERVQRENEQRRRADLAALHSPPAAPTDPKDAEIADLKRRLARLEARR